MPLFAQSGRLNTLQCCPDYGNKAGIDATTTLALVGSLNSCLGSLPWRDEGCEVLSAPRQVCCSDNVSGTNRYSQDRDYQYSGDEVVAC